VRAIRRADYHKSSCIGFLGCESHPSAVRRPRHQCLDLVSIKRARDLLDLDIGFVISEWQTERQVGEEVVEWDDDSEDEARPDIHSGLEAMADGLDKPSAIASSPE
jgi:hypothetical protein